MMSPRILNVHALPQHIAARELAGSTVIVVDLLRASTTICQALASGAREVVPFLDVQQALAAAAHGERQQIVLGGEREGTRIPGFDLGNSPAEYMPAAVQGRRVFVTTTNGTRALDHARLAHRVLVGALVNLSRVVASLSEEPRVDILCAGTDGTQTREDLLAAGAYVDRLVAAASKPWALNAAASAARNEWQRAVTAAAEAARSVSAQVALELRDTPGGRNLLRLGLDQDLVDCSQVDRLQVVPELDLRGWRISAS